MEEVSDMAALLRPKQIRPERLKYLLSSVC
jgi:hypothetical protein